MKQIKLLETSVRNNEQYDLSEIAFGITWTTSIDAQPGRLEFEILDDAKVFLRAGDIIELLIDGQKIFKGKVFKRDKSETTTWKITAYDNMRYLQNEDTLLFNASSSSARFRTICQTQGLPHKIIHHSSYNCTPVIEDKHTYFSMLEDAFLETQRATGARFALRDNYGTVEHFDLRQSLTNIVIGDESLMTSYSYSSSIDEAYNAIKVMREDKETGKREIYVAGHQGNQALWGKLQMVETISDADLNSYQLQKQANDLLREKNREVRTISVDALGHLGLRAGNSFILRTRDLHRDNVGKDNIALITSCTHNFDTAHTMSLEIEV